MSDRDYTIAERAVLILMFAKDIQHYLDKERDELIIGVCKRYAKEDYRESKLYKARSIAAKKKDAYLYTRRFFDRRMALNSATLLSTTDKSPGSSSIDSTNVIVLPLELSLNGNISSLYL